MATSGIHARCDPRARPADIGAALRLSATWQAETAIDELAARHLRIAVHAVALYPELRHQESHHSARDLAIHRAEIAVSGSPGSAWRSATRPRYVRQPSAGQATRPVVASFPILPLSAGLATEPQLQAPGRRRSGLPSPRTGRNGERRRLAARGQPSRPRKCPGRGPWPQGPAMSRIAGPRAPSAAGSAPAHGRSSLVCWGLAALTCAGLGRRAGRRRAQRWSCPAFRGTVGGRPGRGCGPGRHGPARRPRWSPASRRGLAGATPRASRWRGAADRARGCPATATPSPRCAATRESSR